MNLILNVCNIDGCKIRMKDLTQESDEYISEDITTERSLQNYYYNNRFKYSQTYTVNIIKYNSIEEEKLFDPIFTNHDTYLDEAYLDLEKDGYYTVNHFVLPSIEWTLNELSKTDNISKHGKKIYTTDGEKLYQVVNNKLIEIEPKVLVEVNTEDTTISKVVQDTFSICYLYQCYISICKQLFNSTIIKCLTTDSKDLIFKRDFLWMTLNVMKYYTEFGQLYEAQRLLENINYCGTFCNETIKTTNSGCGCNG